MSSVTKKSVSIGDRELEWAEAEADREGVSLSAIVTEALRHLRATREAESQRDRAWSEYMSWFEDSHGPLTVEELEDAARALGLDDERSSAPAAE